MRWKSRAARTDNPGSLHLFNDFPHPLKSLFYNNNNQKRAKTSIFTLPVTSQPTRIIRPFFLLLF
jgi:hypothetical protein